MSRPRLHRDDEEEVGASERLDEAFARLRALPGSALVWCVVGPVPMVLALLFCWADQTRGGGPGFGAAGWAVVLTAVWIWLKVTQAFFARAVWACQLPAGGLPRLSPGGWFRRTGALLVVAAGAVPALVLAAVAVVPFGWVFGFFHQATALAYTHDLGVRPWRGLVGASARLAHHEWWPRHLSLLMLAVLAVLVWGSVFVLGLMVPYLVAVLTGVESEFSRSPLAVAFSPLYLWITVSVSWMILGPYGRVLHVLHAFRGLSRRTGDDLLGRLQSVRWRDGGPGGLLPVLMMMIMVAAGARVRAEPASFEVPAPVSAPAASAAEEVRLSQAIRDTLSQRDYQWRGRGAGAAAASADGVLGALKDALRSVRDGLRAFDRWLSDAGRRLRRLLGAKPGGASSGGGSGLDGDALRAFLVVAGVVAGAGGLFFGVRAWCRRRRRVAPVLAGGAAVRAVDLADETTLASALPEDGWLELARVQREAGDPRLAVRAVFLATLAALGDRRLLEIGRGKSNRDYLHELRRRSVARRDVPEVFGRSVAVFERAWYGWHDVAPEWVSELLENHQRLTGNAPSA